MIIMTPAIRDKKKMRVTKNTKYEMHLVNKKQKKKTENKHSDRYVIHCNQCLSTCCTEALSACTRISFPIVTIVHLFELSG